MNKKKLLIATKNPGKFREIKTVLEDLPLEIVFLGDLVADGMEGSVAGFSGGILKDVQETGTSFAENALMKAEYFAKETGMMTLADDSGIHVDALEGEMGVQTRRWGKGEEANDQEWVDHFLEVMAAFATPEQRRARFVCYVALVSGDERHIFAGQVKGVITENLEAPIIPGLPLSSCFLPDGMKKVFAALSSKEKGEWSHRGQAIEKVRWFLRGRAGIRG